MTYRGSIAFEPPYHRRLSEDAPLPRRKSAKRPEGVIGKWRDPDHYREWKRAWREKHREHVLIYHREYMRTYKK
jgi:hypothetical protein